VLCYHFAYEDRKSPRGIAIVGQRRHELRRLLLVGFLLLATGLKTANAEDVGTPVVDRNPIISSLGFSFVPPGGDNWYEEFKEGRINYYKKMNPSMGSMLGGATEYRTKMTFSTPDEFRQWLASRRNPQDTPPRYRTRNAKYILEPQIGPFCVRYIEEYEDSEAKNLLGQKFLVLFNFGVTCVHPQSPDAIVDIYYSYRYPPDNRNSGLVSEGESFVNSLKVLEVKRQ